jgi:electron transport complex protein RnfG
MSETGPLGLSMRTGLVLFGFTLVFTALMAFTYGATRDIIAASIEAEKLKLVSEILAPEAYDNALLSDFVRLPAVAALGLEEPSRAFRARKGGEPVALLIEAIAHDGYGGDIHLLVAVHARGEVAGVRVTAHKETPGLGDYVDIRKDRDKAHPWITQFNDKGFAQVAEANWRVKKDGGAFAHVTGATISSRAVTHAVGRALKFATANRERLFAAEDWYDEGAAAGNQRPPGKEGS